ncbi:hypothetical protein [Pseudodesulfovibrio senegalensis]|uniref:Uncharacterized protein n=1 Tax=Pseudodesulfovibrio senegalensis TaxID=1721087 RepID=A0A6N6N669_9BACT|nr:hypothetical protein [Pseudodesulfovibrio senegalensis]KAB1443740.1 hypothetical protein F8A88_05755 [Pseudodesulfovibrio senegalensis]
MHHLDEIIKWVIYRYTGLSKVQITVSIIILTLLTISLLCWLFTEKLKDFGLNFFTELLGVIVTIAVIQNIIDRQKRLNYLPLNIAIYRDIHSFISNFISLWETVYDASVSEERPTQLSEFFCPESFNKMARFDLSKQANVLHKTSWFTHFEDSRVNLEEQCSKLLDKYVTHLDPKVYGYIHSILGNFLDKMKFINNIHKLDIQLEMPRQTYLGVYLFNLQKTDFADINHLINWCETNRTELQTKGQLKLPQVALSTFRMLPPYAAMTDKEIQAQNKRFKDWQEAQNDSPNRHVDNIFT